MNTVFFGKASDLSADFSWKDIFSDVFKPHSKDERNRLLTKGIGNNVPSPDQMLKQWQKPWLFFWVGIIGLALSILALFSWNIFAGTGMGVLLFILPAFVMPLTALIFFWEMDISGTISIFETLLMMLLGGILSLTVTGIMRNLLTLPDVDYLMVALPEELSKLIIVLVLLSRSKYRYGLQGILIGGAVGVGFSAIESAGYAWSAFDQSFASQGLAAATQDLTQSLLARGVLSIGGHVVWAALYGGALGLMKKGGKLQFQSLLDPLVIMTWTGAFLLHTLWNLDAGAFVGIFPDSVVIFLYRLESMYIKYAVLILLAWMLLLFVMRKGIRQMVAVSRLYGSGAAAAQPAVQARQSALPQRPDLAPVLTVKASGNVNHGRSYLLVPGKSLVFGRDPARANVTVPPDTRGISAVHCEIKVKDGVPVLIDRNSSYGTFFSNGQKLEPNVPYKIKGRVRFYLADPKNYFEIDVNPPKGH